MSKPMIWKGKTANGEEIKGEAFDEVDVQRRAESMGCTEFTHEANPEYTDADLGAEQLPEVISQSAADAALKDKSDLQVLGEANATLFRQVDEYKNKVLALENQVTALAATLRKEVQKTGAIKTVIVAWNTEQEATAQASGGTYVPPAWMEMIQALA